MRHDRKGDHKRVGSLLAPVSWPLTPGDGFRSNGSLDAVVVIMLGRLLARGSRYAGWPLAGWNSAAGWSPPLRPVAGKALEPICCSVSSRHFARQASHLLKTFGGAGQTVSARRRQCGKLAGGDPLPGGASQLGRGAKRSTMPLICAGEMPMSPARSPCTRPPPLQSQTTNSSVSLSFKDGPRRPNAAANGDWRCWSSAPVAACDRLANRSAAARSPQARSARLMAVARYSFKSSPWQFRGEVFVPARVSGWQAGNVLPHRPPSQPRLRAIGKSWPRAS